MTQVRVKSALPLAIIRGGTEVTVEETDDVKTMIADGKLIVTARFGDNGQPADPEPGDDNWDEYDSAIDAELTRMPFVADTPAPPKSRKTKGD
jgi:hypothetical protein